MNNYTFKTIKRAIKSGIRNDRMLKKLKFTSMPLIAEQIDYMCDSVNPDLRFMLKFNTLQPYLDELVLTYLLYVAKIINIEKLKHVFFAQYTDSFFHWSSAFKILVYCVAALAYGKRLTAVDMLELDRVVVELNEGRAGAIGSFFRENIGAGDAVFDCETKYEQMRLVQVGPFYWRMLHVMAEATAGREGFEEAKQLWRDYVSEFATLTLGCSICSNHYDAAIGKRIDQLSRFEDWPKIWYEMHNEVNTNVKKYNPYPENEFEKDRVEMRKFLKI